MKQCKKGPKRSRRKKPEELRSSVTWASLSSSITSRGSMRETPGAVTHGNRLPWPRPASQRPKRPIGSSRNRGNTSARCSARRSTTWMISGLLRCNKSLNRTPWCGSVMVDFLSTDDLAMARTLHMEGFLLFLHLLLSGLAIPGPGHQHESPGDSIHLLSHAHVLHLVHAGANLAARQALALQLLLEPWGLAVFADEFWDLRACLQLLDCRGVPLLDVLRRKDLFVL